MFIYHHFQYLHYMYLMHFSQHMIDQPWRITCIYKYFRTSNYLKIIFYKLSKFTISHEWKFTRNFLTIILIYKLYKTISLISDNYKKSIRIVLKYTRSQNKIFHFLKFWNTIREIGHKSFDYSKYNSMWYSIFLIWNSEFYFFWINNSL